MVGLHTTVKETLGSEPLNIRHDRGGGAGYAREDIVRALLDAGANGSATNETGKTPLDLVKLEPRNPLNNHPDLLAALEQAAAEAM